MFSKNTLRRRYERSLPWQRPVIAVITVFLFCISLTLVVSNTAYKVSQQILRVEFEKEAEEIRLLIHDRTWAHLEILNGVRNFFSVNDGVDAGAWSAYVHEMNLKRYVGITELCFIERVSSRDAGAFERDHFRIFPEGWRDEYYVVKYIEPDNNSQTLKTPGYDIRTDHAVAQLLKDARDAGRARVTGPLRSPAGNVKERPNFLIALPVYHAHVPVRTMEQRRKALLGFIVAAYKAHSLLQDIFAYRNKNPRIVFAVYDATDHSDWKDLYGFHNGLGEVIPPHHPRFRAIRQIGLAGRTWVIKFASLPGFGERLIQSVFPLSVLFGGMLFSVLISLIVYSLATSHARAVKLAERMTHQVKEHEVEISRLLETTRQLSITDELTGLYNRRGFLTLVEEQMKLARRTKTPLILFFADLDGLKKINDTHGHKEGDQALRDATKVLKRTFRDSDIISRFGGDEFAVLAVNAALDSEQLFRGRLDENLRKLNQVSGRLYDLCLSMGASVVEVHKDLNLEELIISADSKLYEIKRSKKSL